MEVNLKELSVEQLIALKQEIENEVLLREISTKTASTKSFRYQEKPIILLHISSINSLKH
jgi:hypothetical protein